MSAGPKPGAIADRLLARTDGLLRSPRSDRRAAIVLAVAIVAYACAALYLSRGVSFTYDGMTWIVQAREGFAPGSIFEPHNTHLIAVTRFLYAATLQLAGPSGVVIALAQVLAVSATALLLFLLLRRMVGAMVAVVPSMLILFLGSTPVLLDPNVAVFAQSTAFGLGAFLALERDDRLGDFVACALLLLGVLAFTLGVPFAVGAGVLIAARSDRLRRSWIVLVPLLVFGIWFIWAQRFQSDVFALGGGEPQFGQLSNLLLAPNFAADSLAAGLAATTGLGVDLVAGSAGTIGLGWGRILAVAFLVGVGWRILRTGLPVRVAAFAAVLIVYWIAGTLGLSLFRVPAIDRYAFPTAVLCILILAEVFKGPAVTRGLWLALVAALVFALLPNISQMRSTGAMVRTASATARADLAMVELARDDVEADLQVSADLLIPVPAGDYLDLADRFGSVAFSEQEVLAQSAEVREQADLTLDRILDLEFVGADGAPSGACFDEARSGGPIELDLPPGGAVLRAPAASMLRLRRFADDAAIEVGEIPADGFAALEIPTDASARPWVASIDGAASVEVCSIGGGAA